MKPKDKIERFVAETRIGTGDKRDRQVLNEVLQVHEDFKHRQPQEQQPRIWRTFMAYPRMRIAAVATVAVVLVGVFSFGGGTVAFSQARRAVSSTLSMLKNMIAGVPTEAPRTTSPSQALDTSPNRRKILCESRFFEVSDADPYIWQRLKDQGVTFIEASAAPKAQYATLGPEQAQSFRASITLRCIYSPTVLMLEGETAAIAIGSLGVSPRGLAIALQPEASSDGKHIQFTLSFHDGLNGFEIPDVSTEPGGAILIHTKDMFPGGDGVSKELLICLPIEIQ
jgi:hypothetical protein